MAEPISLPVGYVKPQAACDAFATFSGFDGAGPA
jgi:hypothetical protein